MIRFCALFATPSIGLLLLNARDLLNDGWRSFNALLLLTAGPLLAAAAAAWIAEARHPRRWAAASFGDVLADVIVVLGAGALSVGACLATQLYAWWPRLGFGGMAYIAVDTYWPLRTSAIDVASVLAPALVVATCVALFQPARRAGTCRRCGYDISHSLEVGRCPECAEPIAGL